MEPKRLFRSRTDTMLGGVCAGLAKYFTLDPTVVRLIFVLLFIMAGQGLLLYLILWLVVPLEPAA
ncbi:MAG TPA: PspC domain-containing protein [Bellilinea sp.]